VPTELEKQIVVIEHELPGRDQLEDLARSLATEDGELPEGEELGTVLDAASGLARYEAEAAFSLSLVREGAIRPQSIWELKSQMLKKSGLLTLHRGRESFADLGGLDALKSFCTRAMRRQGEANPLKRPRGVLLLGVPGTGKSQFCKALGNETGRPTLTLDIGSLMICTCNDISRLPPEFARAERFDGVFFLDLPGAAQKGSIWNICLNLFDLDADQQKPCTQDWTGAEIRSCCRLAALLDVPLTESARNVVPVAVTAAETVDRLRNWASGRCLDADRLGIYTNGQTGPKRRRKIKTDPHRHTDAPAWGISPPDHPVRTGFCTVQETDAGV
jgi:hypothetical protein